MEIVYQKNKDKQPVYDMYQEIFEDPERLHNIILNEI
mgnify:CR=1 FL=1